MSKELKLPEGNKFVQKMLGGWFGGWASYLEYQKSKKIADVMAENEGNKIKIAGEIEEIVIREKLSMIESLEMADKFVEYENLYDTLTKAVPKIDINSNGNIEPDKMKRLKDLSKEFSSDEMQDLIANILAGEYNKPGSYSLNTMAIIKNLSKDEIELFRKFSSIIINGDFIFGNLFQINNNNIQKLIEKGINWGDYLYLQELGLCTGSNTVQQLGNKTEKKYNYEFNISNKKIILSLEGEINLTNQANLTKAGKELYKLIDPIFDDELFEICKNELIIKGFKEIKK